MSKFPEITADELRTIGTKIPKGNALGRGGVSYMVIKTLAIKRPQLLIGLRNSCLVEGVFLRAWKLAKMVLLRKGNRSLDQPSSYRPI